MQHAGDTKATASRLPASGLTGWLLLQFRKRFRAADHIQPRLALIERIALAPGQSLSLVEAEGRRFLVASSGGSRAVFCALDGLRRPGLRGPVRIS